MPATAISPHVKPVENNPKKYAFNFVKDGEDRAFGTSARRFDKSHYYLEDGGPGGGNQLLNPQVLTRTLLIVTQTLLEVPDFPQPILLALHFKPLVKSRQLVIGILALLHILALHLRPATMKKKIPLYFLAESTRDYYTLRSEAVGHGLTYEKPNVKGWGSPQDAVKASRGWCGGAHHSSFAPPAVSAFLLP